MNAIVIIAPNKDNFLKYCMPGALRLAEKSDAVVVTIREEAYGIEKTSGYNYKIFEKFQVQRYTDKFDRILRLDADIVISPECPNIFALHPEDKLWVTFEDVGSRKKDRRGQMAIAQKALGLLPQWDKGYFNSGVVLTSKKHRELYNLDKRAIREIIKLPLGKYKEQSVLNHRARSLNFEIGDMGYKFNHLSMFKENPRDSYIVHVAGKQSGKEGRMRELYRYWYGR